MQQRLWNALWQRAADVSTVVFDIGGTLLDWNPQKVKALLPEAYRERLFHALFVPDHTWRWSAFDLGAVPQEEAAANIAREEGLPQCEQAVLDALNGVAWDDDTQVTQLHVFKLDRSRFRDRPVTHVMVMWEE